MFSMKKDNEMNDKSSCIRYYNNAAKDYDVKRFSCECRKIIDNVFKGYIFEIIKDKENILDAGTGTGRFAVFFAEKGKKVIAMDISTEMLAKAKANAVEKRVDNNINFIKGDIETIPLGDNSVDAISTIHVLVHYPNVEKAIGEFYRVLRPEGFLVFEVANSFIARTYNQIRTIFLKQECFSYADYYHKFSDIKNILEKKGFSVCVVKKVKKIPKIIMHFLMCVLHIKICKKFILWLEKYNFGTVTIVKAVKN